jgi:hypothetical protein
LEEENIIQRCISEQKGKAPLLGKNKPNCIDTTKMSTMRRIVRNDRIRFEIQLLFFVYYYLMTSNVSSFTTTIVAPTGSTTNYNYYYTSNNNMIQQQKQQYQKNHYTTTTRSKCSSSLSLYMSLKPAALPLMDSGKSLARCGELLIDYTKELELLYKNINYNNLGNAGAQIRNAGDCLAQVGASCRFKTGIELIIDELRESATCLLEAYNKINSQIQFLQQDTNNNNNNKDDSIVQLTRTLGMLIFFVTFVRFSEFYLKYTHQANTDWIPSFLFAPIVDKNTH